MKTVEQFFLRKTLMIVLLFGFILKSNFAMACNPDENCMRQVCYFFGCSQIEDPFCASAKSSCRSFVCGLLDTDVTKQVDQLNTRINVIDEALSTNRSNQSMINLSLEKNEILINNQTKICHDLEISQTNFLNNTELQRSLITSLELLTSTTNINSENIFDNLKNSLFISEQNKIVLEKILHQAIDSNISVSNIVLEFKTNSFFNFEKVLSQALIQSLSDCENQKNSIFDVKKVLEASLNELKHFEAQKMAEKGNLVGEKNAQSSRRCH